MFGGLLHSPMHSDGPVVDRLLLGLLYVRRAVVSGLILISKKRNRKGVGMIGATEQRV